MTRKIEVLRQAISKLEGGVYYNFFDISSCNCGLVVQACLQISQKELSNLIEKETDKSYLSVGNWNMMCESTGLPMSLVFRSLKEAGFTTQEIGDLEVFRGKKVLAKIGVGAMSCDSKVNLVSYLKAWVSILEEQQPRQAMIEPKEKVRRVYVTVSPEVRRGDLVNSNN